MVVDWASHTYATAPQMTPPMMVAHLTLSIPRLRRNPVPIWTNDSKITYTENSQNVGALLQLCAAWREPDSEPQVYSSRPARHMASQAARIPTPRAYPIIFLT